MPVIYIYCFLLLPLIGNVKSQSGRWYVGGPGESCDTACKKRDLVCTIEGLKSHNEDVDSPKKIWYMLKFRFGKYVSRYELADPDDPRVNPCLILSTVPVAGLPLFSKKSNNGYGRTFCFSTSPNKKRFSCKERPKGYDFSQRICYCFRACATVYENHNFQGSSIIASEGKSGVIHDLWTSNRPWNDRVSSVKVNPGCVFKGYINSPSAYVEEQPLVQLTGDSNLQGDYDNAISGWNCQCGVCATIYENHDFQGSWQYAFPQATSGVIHDLYTSDRWWNDRISSVKVNPGCVFKGYKHTHFEKQPLVELKEDSNLEGDKDNAISGWNCQCGGDL